MKANEVGHWVVEENLRFFYSFTTLSFGTLALSLQFSSKMGHEYPSLLVISWVLLFLACLGNGYRLWRLQYLYAVDAKVSEAVEKGQAEKVEQGRKIIRDKDSVLVKVYYFNLIVYMLGIAFNLMFAIVNFLHPINCPIVQP